MPNTFATTFIPAPLQWWGWGKEAANGTVVAPTMSMPLDKGLPNDKPTELIDKGLRGYMGEDYNMIVGTEIADLPVSGDVYLDSIGHPLLNLFGDYTAVGSTPGTAWTATGGVTAGAGPITVTSGAVATQGSTIQIGAGTNAELVTVGSGSTATSIVIAATTPIRMNHTGSTQILPVVAPYIHTFALLNGGGGLTPISGLNAQGQPPTHTITYHDQLSANGGRAYPYWCCSGIDFKADREQLFQHDTKGMSVIGVDLGSAATNSQGSVPAIPDWEFIVKINSVQVNNVADADVSLARGLKADFGLNNQQAPYLIARLGLSVTGKLTFLAADESPRAALLAGTQQPLSIQMTNGLSGAAALGVAFNFQVAQYETVAESDPDVLQWEVNFRALMNSTNVGASGGQGPGTVVITNNVVTY